jgi:predicted nucleotidyltransferase
MDGFRKIVEMLGQQRISCEVVVDGSYLTEEINPEDIDFAVVVSPAFYENCMPEQRKLLDWIGDDKNIKREHLCDCYLCVDYKQEDEGWFEGICDRMWWVNFGLRALPTREFAVSQL